MPTSSEYDDDEPRGFDACVTAGRDEVLPSCSTQGENYIHSFQPPVIWKGIRRCF